jgi:hypothetical protein
MKAALLVALIGGLFGGSSGTRTVYVYYGAEMPFEVGSITVRSPIISATMLVCEDGYQTSYNPIERVREENERSGGYRSKSIDRRQLIARSNKYRRDFPVPRNASPINVPKCAIVWPSGVFREIPSFSVDVSDAKLPLEVVKDVERVMSAVAADLADLESVNARNKSFSQEMDRMGAAADAPPQRPINIDPPPPVYAPPALPAMPSVSPPSPPGRTTTICRTLSNGTIVCN